MESAATAVLNVIWKHGSPAFMRALARGTASGVEATLATGIGRVSRSWCKRYRREPIS
jgi:hypothetical protein